MERPGGARRRRNIGYGLTPSWKQPQAGSERRRGERRAPVVSRSTSQLTECESVTRMRTMGGVLGREHTADRRSYILCLLEFNPPNPNATFPANQRKMLRNQFTSAGRQSRRQPSPAARGTSATSGGCLGRRASYVCLFQSGTYSESNLILKIETLY